MVLCLYIVRLFFSYLSHQFICCFVGVDLDIQLFVLHRMSELHEVRNVEEAQKAVQEMLLKQTRIIIAFKLHCITHYLFIY